MAHVKKQIDKLEKYVGSFSGFCIITLNMEYGVCLSLVKEKNVEQKLITFFTSCPAKEKAIKEEFPNIEVIVENFNKFLDGSSVMDKRDKRIFDCVVMNPPYQDDSGNRGRGHTLWTEFVEKSISITKENGYISAIHPSLWRQVDNETGKLIKSKQIHYMEIHGIEDGIKTFGVTTRYDWYILQNKNNDTETTLVDEKGEKIKMVLNNVRFIPNFAFNIFEKILAKDGEDRVKIINDRTNYGADKEWVSKEETSEFKYPCVYYISADGDISLKWSRINSNGHFGIPKIIFPSGVYKSTGLIIDKDGAYGMTEWCSGIVDDIKNLDLIAKAIKTQKFLDFSSATFISKTELNPKVISLFRKDFWKEFV